MLFQQDTLSRRKEHAAMRAFDLLWFLLLFFWRIRKEIVKIVIPANREIKIETVKTQIFDLSFQRGKVHAGFGVRLIVCNAKLADVCIRQRVGLLVNAVIRHFAADL